MRDPFSMSDWRRRYVLMAENDKETSQDLPPTEAQIEALELEAKDEENNPNVDLLSLYEKYTKTN